MSSKKQHGKQAEGKPAAGRGKAIDHQVNSENQAA